MTEMSEKENEPDDAATHTPPGTVSALQETKVTQEASGPDPCPCAPSPGCPLPDAVTAVGSGALGSRQRDPPMGPARSLRLCAAPGASGPRRGATGSPGRAGTTRPCAREGRTPAATLRGGCNSAWLEGIGAAKAEGVCSGV